jgi:hypothetical protein
LNLIEDHDRRFQNSTLLLGSQSHPEVLNFQDNMGCFIIVDLVEKTEFLLVSMLQGAFPIYNVFYAVELAVNISGQSNFRAVKSILEELLEHVVEPNSVSR